MITNPENLSKDRLKAELKKKGIKFNANENKQYYVDLYRSQVMKGSRARDRGEFSDDEVKHSPRVSPRKSRRKVEKADESNLVYTRKLTDEILKKELISYGENPGPITAATRDVYQRKLARLLEDNGSLQQDVEVAEVDDVDVDEKEISYVAEWSDTEEDVQEVEEDEVKVKERPTQRVEKHVRVEYGLRGRRPGQSSSKLSYQSSEQLPPPPPASHRSRRGGSETCSAISGLILIICCFTLMFLCYEHLTVPEGEKSILVSGYERAKTTVFSVFTPMMAGQRVTESVTESVTEPVITPTPIPKKEETLPPTPPPKKEETPPPTPPPKKEETPTPPPKKENSSKSKKKSSKGKKSSAKSS